MHRVILKGVDISAQILLENLVLALSLSIYLGIVYSTKALVDAQVMAEYCPER
jgi:hypothetical protein